VRAPQAHRPGVPDVYQGDEVPRELRGRWRDVLGDREVELGAEARLAHLAGPLPVALLERA
jgi:hypothetical protein